jgi:hypothetical protein
MEMGILKWPCEFGSVDTITVGSISAAAISHQDGMKREVGY